MVRQTSCTLVHKVIWDCVTYSADEAGIMPGISQGIQELVPSLDRELAAVTTSSKQSIEIYTERH